MNHFQGLMGYLETLPVINVHSHFEDKSEDMSLDYIFSHSYVAWIMKPAGRTKAERTHFIDRIKYNTYYIWLEKALRELYGLGELSAENWDMYSERIRESYKLNPEYSYEIFKRCGYEKIILDAYWDPGSNHGRPRLFSPAYRIDMFFSCYGKEKCDRDGNNTYRLYGVFPDTLEEYVAFMRKQIANEKKKGCCAIKCAVAYDRDIDFQPVSLEKAKKAYRKIDGEPTKGEIKDFQDYIFFELCKIAAELDMTLQCHTGLGLMKHTGAIWLHRAIESNPDTRFSLMHGSYPYPGDLMGLIHNYKNVYADICWLPMISTACAIRTIEELLEVATSDKICWGCDAWTAEESYGALFSIRYTLSKIADIKIQEGFWSQKNAEEILKRILYTNAKELFFEH